MVLHAGQSGDFYPHHMDPEFGTVVEKLEVLNQRDECAMACELLLVRRCTA